MHRCQHSFKIIPSILWVVLVGYISFQEISYAGKPQVVSSCILSNLWVWPSFHQTRHKVFNSNLNLSRLWNKTDIPFNHVSSSWKYIWKVAPQLCVENRLAERQLVYTEFDWHSQDPVVLSTVNRFGMFLFQPTNIDKIVFKEKQRNMPTDIWQMTFGRLSFDQQTFN